MYQFDYSMICFYNSLLYKNYHVAIQFKCEYKIQFLLQFNLNLNYYRCRSYYYITYNYDDS